MPINILMPALSPTMTEGNLAKWHKQEGDTVTAGDVLAEIETDKATMEVEAVDEGVLGKIVVPEGAEGVKVNEIIGMLLEDGEDAASVADAPAPAAPSVAPPPPPAASAPLPVENMAGATPLAERIARQAGLDLASVRGTGAHGKITRMDVQNALEQVSSLGSAVASAAATAPTESAQPSGGDGARVAASPLARRMAGQAGLDLGSVGGTGPGGRIVKSDIEVAMTSGAKAAPAPAAQRPVPAPVAARETAPGAPSEVVRLSTMRKVIAKRMTESKTTVPHFYLTVDCEIDELMRVRAELNARQDGVKISVNDFVIRACAMALMEVPAANVSYETETEIRQHHTADISVAVAIEGGLITPIVRSAEAKGLAQVSAEMRDLAGRARDGKLMPEEYQGGSFSISNLGMFGVKQFDAVINPPQACILAVGAGEKRPVVKDGEIVAATVMSCTLSVDHRVVDGAIGAQLLAAIKRFIEYPPAMLL